MGVAAGTIWQSDATAAHAYSASIPFAIWIDLLARTEVRFPKVFLALGAHGTVK
jgi:hypothetical protein